MGLKTGCAAFAAQRGLFVLLNKADGHPFMLAQVETTPEMEFQLVYPDGSRGILKRNRHSQLHLVKVLPNLTPEWKPSEEQALALVERLPRERIIFNGDYVIGDKPDSDFPPPAVYVNDEERFREPHGPWEEAVARYLRIQPDAFCV